MRKNLKTRVLRKQNSSMYLRSAIHSLRRGSPGYYHHLCEYDIPTLGADPFKRTLHICHVY